MENSYLVAAEHDGGDADVGAADDVEGAAAEVDIVPARDRFEAHLHARTKHGMTR